MKIIFLSILLIQISYLTGFFFDLTSGLERCYIEELFEESTALIKYKVFTYEKGGEKFIRDNIEILNINVYDEHHRRLAQFRVKNLKDKFTYQSKADGYYRFCVEATGGT